jgi:16S rRNA processing protein RimM
MPEPGDALTRAWVWLARIRRPQGRKGEVFAEILTDFPDKFAERKQLWLLVADAPAKAGAGARPAAPTPRQMVLENHWLHKGGVVLHFAGVTSITEAEALAGLIVAIPRAERAELDEDAVYVGDLIGCTLVDVSGAEAVAVGAIEDVDRTGGAAPLLVVHGAKGEVLVPFAKSYLRKVDLDAKRVEMELPEGLVDLSKAEEA